MTQKTRTDAVSRGHSPNKNDELSEICVTELTQRDLDHIALTVPGGARNVQDIYPLSSLQEGMLFHRLLNNRRDTYVLSVLFELDSASRLGALVEALQVVIRRHDVLRTAILWEGLPRPVQVVYREAVLPVENILLDSGRERVEQLMKRMRPDYAELDMRRAPLMRLQIAAAPETAKSHAILHVHHSVCDHRSLNLVVEEALLCLDGRTAQLPVPISYQSHVVAARPRGDAEAFFRAKLGGLDEPTAPFGLIDVHGSSGTLELRQAVDATLAEQVRTQARETGVSPARLFHAVWGLVVARTAGRDDIVFGTVLSAGRKAALPGGGRMLGMSVNTLPLRLSMHGLSAWDLVQRTDRELTELMKHEHTPLPLAQHCSGIDGSAPLFTSLLNYRHPVGAKTVTTSARAIAQGEAWTNYPLALTVDDLRSGFMLTVQTDRRIDPTRIAGYVQTAMRSLLQALSAAPDTPATRLSVLPEAEKIELVEAFNATRIKDSPQPLVHELFEQQAHRTPNAPALVYGEGSLSYTELNAQANRVAWYLRSRGVGPDRLVALCVERSPALVVGLLGILKAGGAYVPVDANYPRERLMYMLEEVAPPVILTQKHLIERLPETRAEVLALDADDARLAECSDAGLPSSSHLKADHLAYLIFTSGSTGRPKAAQVTHRGFSNLMRWYLDDIGFRQDESVLLLTSQSFDLTQKNIVGPLCVGGTLHLAAEPFDAQNILEQIGKQRITHINLAPSAFHALVDSDTFGRLGSLRRVVLGGEPVRPDKLLKLREPRPQFINSYGPTECSDVVACYPLAPDLEVYNDSAVPLGRPIRNTRLYVLDGNLQPAPLGVSGEICIGGTAVGRGYLNRPELTRERFVPDPFSTEPDALLYRTGDLARWHANGTLEYLGRSDHQLKIRGFRIELGEIEAQLVRHAQVKEAVVVAREDAPGDKRLAAYFVPRELADSPAPETLRAHLVALVPEYMVPSAFVALERLPLSPNGKLDRRALPAPERGAYARTEYEAPRGEVEEALADAWQELLHVERVGRRDNFFRLGGHSLLLVQMMERLRRRGLSIEVRRVFESPTLADLAAEVTRTRAESGVPDNLIPAGCKEITPEMLTLVELQRAHIERIATAVPGGHANIQDIYPLAPLQEGILFHHRVNEKGGDPYLASTLLSISSRETLDRLIRALQSVVDRHDVLRTSIHWDDLPHPVQVVHRSVRLPVEEIKLDVSRDPRQQLEEWPRGGRQRMDLRRAPLIRLQVAAHSDGVQWYAWLQFHHIVADNTSREIVTSEVVSYLNGEVQELPKSIPYRTHVAQAMAAARLHDADAYFRSRLASVDEPTAPFGLLDVHGDGSTLSEAHCDVERGLAQKLRAEAASCGVTVATLFHAAFALVVARTSGRNDAVFGSVLLGRLQGDAGARRVLGMFINTLPLRVNLEGLSAKKLVEQTHRELVGLLSHEQASLALAQRCSGIAGSAPLFSALLNYRHRAPDAEAEWAGARGIRVLGTQDLTNYPLTLSVDDLGEGFRLTAQSRIDPRRVAGHMHAAVSSLVEALSQAPDTDVQTLSILPDEERRELMQVFNATETHYPQTALVHELFEEQVKRRPLLRAVIHEGRSLSYAELNAQANRLARYLRDRGVGADRIVGLCMERSPEMIVGVLAILKAGGAYMPLDPNYPPDRLRYMLDDARPTLVLTQAELRSLLPGSATAIDVKEVLKEIERYPAEDRKAVREGNSASQLVYVIYTSGSTGRPKGTAMPHRAMLNLMEWHRQHLPLDPGERVLQFAALSFDVAFQEIFSTLCGGGTLVLLDEWIRRDARALMQLLQKQSVERLFVPPLMLQSLAGHCRSAGQVPHELRNVITAGEQLRIGPEITELFSRLNGCRLHNHYGPTETHVVTALTLDGSPQAWPELPTIGRPVSNTRIYILDGEGRLVPVGVTGEIFIAGACVARGYLHRPDLTAARFVRDPFGTGERDLAYRTGDLGRWRADGTIEYLGRNDHQVKIRGFRIEPGEIEAQLSKNNHVKEAAVIAREDLPGQKRLVAYITLREGCDLNIQQLRTQLKSDLPDFMVPAAFVMLESLPQTPSGKLDRRALPPPGESAYVTPQYEAPEGETEAIVAKIWQDLLHVPRIGRSDDFFDAGGHSLIAMQVTAAVRSKLGVEPPIRALFDTPRLWEFAALLDELRRGRLRESVLDGGVDMEALLSEIAAMPEGRVEEELLRRFSREGTL